MRAADDQLDAFGQQLADEDFVTEFREGSNMIKGN